MEKAEIGRALKAGMAYSGTSRRELSRVMGIHVDTLGKKLKDPSTLTVAQLIAADKAIRWTAFMEGQR